MSSEPTPAGRDYDCLDDARARLEATNLFDGVYAGLPEDIGLTLGDGTAACVEPWREREDVRTADCEGVGTHRASWRLTLISRDADPHARDRALDRLLAAARDALDGVSLAGVSFPALTRLGQAQYAKPKPPERRCVVTGEFDYLVAPGGHLAEE